MSIEESSNLSNIDEDDFSDEVEMENQLESAFGDYFLEYIIQSEKYAVMIEKQQVQGVKAYRMKVTFHYEIKVKAFNDYHSSLFLSRQQLPKMLRPEQVDFVKQNIVDYFLNTPYLKSDTFSSLKQLRDDYVITQNVVDEIGNYVKAILRVGRKIAEGISIAIELSSEGECVYMSQQLQLMLQTYEDLQTAFNTQDYRTFLQLLDQVLANTYQEIFAASLLSVLTCFAKTRNERLRAFFVSYKLYQQNIYTYFPQEIRLLMNELLLQTETDSLTEKYEKLRSKVSQIAQNKQMVVSFIAQLKSQVDGMICGREAAQFQYFEFASLLNMSDKDNLSVFSDAYKGEPAENYVELLPFLVKKQFDYLVQICYYRDETDDFIRSVKNEEVRQLVQACIEQFRSAYILLYNEAYAEKRYVEVIRSINFDALEVSNDYEYAMAKYAIADDQDKNYDDELEITAKQDAIKHAMEQALKVQLMKIKAGFFLFFSRCVNSGYYFDGAATANVNYEWVADLIKQYRKYFEVHQFTIRVLETILSFQRLLQDVTTPENVRNIIDQDFDQTIGQYYDHFIDTGYICQYDEQVRYHSEKPQQLMESRMTALFSEIIVSNPLVLKQFTIESLQETAVTAVDEHTSVRSVQLSQDEQNEQMRKLYEQLKTNPQSIDLEDPYLFTDDIATSSIYSPNDPFSSVIFLDQKPLLLYHRQFARGLNKTQFLYVKHLYESQKRNVTIYFENIARFNFEEFTQYGITTQSQLIERALEESIISCIVYLLEQHALAALSSQAFQYFSTRLSQPKFNPFSLPQSGDLDPRVISTPFVSDLKVDKQDYLVITAAEKGYRICTAIPANLLQETVDDIISRTQTTFVVTDCYGRYIDNLTLRCYETPMPNPFKLGSTIDYRTQILNVMRQSGVTNTNDYYESCKIEREKLNSVLQQFFSQLTQMQLQRIIDEAYLMDFLAKNAVCAVGVLYESFSGSILKQQLTDTLSYLNQPFPTYYNEQDLSLKREYIYEYTHYVFCPMAGEKAIIGKNILMLNDFIYKRIKLAPHIAKIILVDVPGDIPMYVLKSVYLFDISMDVNKEGISDMNPYNYCSTAAGYLFNNLDLAIMEQLKSQQQRHFGTFNYLWDSELLSHTNRFQLSTLRYNDLEEPALREFKVRQNSNYYELQKSYFIGQKPSRVSRPLGVAVLLGLHTARYLLDPVAVLCQLTLGDAQPENYLYNNMFAFLPDFMPFHATNSLEIEICPDSAQFYESLKLRFKDLLVYAEYVAVIKQSYDFNLCVVSPHYLYAISLLPGLSLRKMHILWKYMQFYNVDDQHRGKNKAKSFTNIAFKDIDAICYLYDTKEHLVQMSLQEDKSNLKAKFSHVLQQLIYTCDSDIVNISEKIKSSTDFNMFGELISSRQNDQINLRFVRSKNQLLSALLQNMIIEQLYYKMLETLFESNPEARQICYQYLERQNFGRLKFNPIGLREKFGFKKTDTTVYLLALVMSNKLQISPNTSIGTLVAQYFEREDYELMRSAVCNLYQDLTGYITITPEVLLSYPGSPYSSPINVSYCYEYKHPITHIAIHNINFYTAGFYLSYFQISPAFKVTSTSLLDFDEDKSWKSATAVSLNEFGSRYSYNPENLDSEKKKKEVITKYNCQLIGDGVLNGLTMYDRTSINEYQYRCVCFILSLIEYISGKTVRSDLYDTLETNYYFVTEQQNLLTVYQHFHLQEREVPQISSQIDDCNYINLLYTLLNGQQLCLFGLSDEEYSFELSKYESQIQGIYKSYKAIVLDLLYKQANLKLTVNNIEQVFEMCQSKPSQEDQLQFLKEQQYFSQLTNTDGLLLESFEVEKFLSQIRKNYEFGLYNLFEKVETLASRGVISALLQDKFQARSGDRAQLRRFLKVILAFLKQMDPRVNRLFANFQITDSYARHVDPLESAFDFIQRFKNDERVVSKVQLSPSPIFKSDPQLIFLLQTKQQNAKFFYRFYELQVEIPYNKRQLYATQKESTSFDVICVNIPGLRGSIPSGGKENEVDLSGAFTAYLDGVDFMNNQIFLRTYIVTRNDAIGMLGNGVYKPERSEQKINISDIVKNIRENQWRANMLEYVVSTEASYRDNPVLIGENFKSAIPTSFGRDNYAPRYFNQSTSMSDAQVAKSRPEPLKRADIEKFRRPVEHLEQICLQKLILSYCLADFYILNSPGEGTEYIYYYHNSSFLESLGIRHYIDTTLSATAAKYNEDGIYALIAQFRSFLLKSSQKQFDQVAGNSKVLQKRFVENFQQFYGFKQSQIDVEVPYVREDLIRCVRLFYYMRFMSYRAFFNLNRLSVYFKLIQSYKFTRRYKNEMQAAFQRTQFKREISHAQFHNIKQEYINDFFAKNKNQICVFLPAPGTYSYIFLAIQTPRADANNVKYALFRIYEDEQYKPVENNYIMLQNLSAVLYLDKFEHFPDLKQTQIRFKSLDEILTLFVYPIYRQYRELLKSSKFINYTDRGLYKRELVRKNDFACYFSDCKANKLTFLMYSPRANTSAEHVYLLNDGVVFRNKFVVSESFISQFAARWVFDNWRTFEVSNKKSNVTVYRESAEWDVE